MKYNLVEYTVIDPDTVKIEKVGGYNSMEDLPEVGDNARVVLESLGDVQSLGGPVIDALAKFKAVEPTPEAIWEHFNPTPNSQKVESASETAPVKTRKPRAKRENKDLPTGDVETTSEVTDIQSGNEDNMAKTDKEKAAALKEKEKAAKAKEKEKIAAAKVKEKEKAAKEKEKIAAAKAKEKEKAAKAKEKEKAAKEKGKAAGTKKRGAPTGPRGEKTMKIKHLLERKTGCTRKEILEATGWPTVSVQAIAKNCQLKLRTEKEKGKPIRYFGTPTK